MRKESVWLGLLFSIIAELLKLIDDEFLFYSPRKLSPYL